MLKLPTLTPRKYVFWCLLVIYCHKKYENTDYVYVFCKFQTLNWRPKRSRICLWQNQSIVVHQFNGSCQGKGAQLEQLQGLIAILVGHLAKTGAFKEYVNMWQLAINNGCTKGLSLGKVVGLCKLPTST